MSESLKKINKLRNLNPEEFYIYTKQIIQKYPEFNDTGLLAMEVSILDNLNDNPKGWVDFRKKQFKANNEDTINEVLDNIEKTMEGQPIYREIIICGEKKKDIDLNNVKIREPIGSAWSYIPQTHSFYTKGCSNSEEEKPILIKGNLLDKEGINVDKSLILNLNWRLSTGSEHEIRLKEGSKIHVEEICEKNWIGRRSSSGLPMIKQCKKINQEFTS